MKKAIITHPARLVRAFWDVRNTIDEPAPFAEALTILLRHFYDGLALSDEPLLFYVGGDRNQRCEPYTLFAAYRQGSWKVVGLDGHKKKWVMDNHAMLSQDDLPFRPGFWDDTRRGAALLAHHIELGTGPLWHQSISLDRESPIKWAFLALTHDDPNWVAGKSQSRRIGAHMQQIINWELPEKLLDLSPNEARPTLVIKRCEAILEHARNLPAIPTKQEIKWEQLTPIPGQAVTRHLAYYFTRDPNGPHLSWDEAGRILGLAPRSVRRSAKLYEQHL